MKRIQRLFAVTLTASALVGTATAQNYWSGECLDPMNTMPYSTDYGTMPGGPTPFGNTLMRMRIGISGTVTYGGTTGPCYFAARTLDASGRFTFGTLGVGSVHSTFDDSMAYTVGFPSDPVGDFAFAKIFVDDVAPQGANSVVFGGAGLSINYIGLSKRYMVAGANDALDTDVQLQMKSLGDTMRFRWRITNTGTESHTVGLYWSCYTGMRLGPLGDTQDHLGFNQANSVLPTATGNAKFVNNYVGFNVLPDGRPLRTEYRRFITDPDFPRFYKSMWGQTEAYGMRFDNLPGEDTLDASNTDFIKIGNHGTTSFDNNISLNLFGDPLGTMNQNDIQLANPTVVQRFPGQTIGAGQQFDIVHYLRSTWSVGDYNDPYAIVLDAPRLVNFPGGGTNGLSPNPMTVRLWLDNQYATIEKDVSLAVVKATITLPAGLSFAAGQTPVKFLNNVAPNTLDAIDWSIVSDGTTFGDLPISVKVETVPGPTKFLNTIIRVAAAPRLNLVAGPNMVTFPYNFGDSNLDHILNLVSGVDFVAFQWDPELRGYQPVQSIQRGFGYWVVPSAGHPNHQLAAATVPVDQATGGLLVSLKSGWNLIGNPYNYPVRLSQLVGVAEDNPTDALSWSEMVQNEYVTSALTFFEANQAAPGGGTYRLTTAGDPWVEPHVAYWLFVRTFKELRLVWPPVFIETLPNAGRGDVIEKPWAQTDREWKLQLSARSTYGYDANNFVGVISDRQKARRASIEKAPQAPGQELQLAILNETPGQESRMAQSVSDRVGRNEWKVQVKADRAGDVTLTWPNLASMPRGIRARITDDVTGEKKDLRTTSGYTFRMAEAGTRSFTLSVEPGGSNKAVIGNVMVQPAGRDANSPVVINYTLSADALVTVRVLSSTGKEVYTVSRGRSDGAGDNSVTWTLRDNANRAVAPGTYTVEILAETVSGERVRRVIPVNVIR